MIEKNNFCETSLKKEEEEDFSTKSIFAKKSALFKKEILSNGLRQVSKILFNHHSSLFKVGRRYFPTKIQFFIIFANTIF